ncbi:hypothetical protein J5Y04_13775 [Kitasatospora sp. RG8]|uniref:hypothetical protein n=1 Tax=Kitasatospora sp. RG8 TaxID=2820815 RepID=UPI001ADFC111|nr:hypothetical protein [Kitasatospora sp. RG8]MBP0450605.1 hypothetical protein [Kitasatospora sp. RG8]
MTWPTGRSPRSSGIAEKTVKNQVPRLLAEAGVERRLQPAVLAAHADTEHRPERSH